MNKELLKKNVQALIDARKKIDWILEAIDVEAPKVSKVLRAIIAPTSAAALEDVLGQIESLMPDAGSKPSAATIKTWLTVAQFMDRTGICRSNTYKLLSEPKKYGLVVVNYGKRLRIDPASVDAYIAAKVM